MVESAVLFRRPVPDGDPGGDWVFSRFSFAAIFVLLTRRNPHPTPSSTAMPSPIASFADEKEALSPTPASPHSSTQRWCHWYNELDTPAERKLLAKIDVLILVPLCAGYFVKILDSSAVSTAYVSGMKTAVSGEEECEARRSLIASPSL